jgi:GDP-4-dehydro-6-deoxy-D-mannose reductase
MNNKKLLITGFAGFVSWHFVEFLYEKKLNVEIYGIDVRFPRFDIDKYSTYLDIHFKKIDMTNITQLQELFEEFIPDYILHLAAYSSVAYSWKNPSESFLNNSNIFLNLIGEIQKSNPKCRILSVGSSEEYDENHLPIKEDQDLNPTSPYAVARVAQEMLAKIFVETYHLDIVLTRSFNHIGPGQDDRFVVSSFIKQIIAIQKSGHTTGTIETGDISVVRDFVDVRDVVRAYYLLLLNGKSGEAYNICSGNGIVLKDLVSLIAKQVGVSVSTEINESFVRPRDNRIVIGSYEKIKNELGWSPEIKLNDTIHDILTCMDVS